MYAARTLPLIVPAAAGMSMAGYGTTVLLALLALVVLVAAGAIRRAGRPPGGPAEGPGA